MAGVPIAVAFGGLTMTVSITPSGSLYTDANLTTAATFPVTTSTDTTWYASPSTGPYSVSIKFNGVELADPSGAAATVSATSGAAFTPAANLTSTRAEVADASAYPARPGGTGATAAKLDYFNPKDYGAKLDAAVVTASITSGELHLRPQARGRPVGASRTGRQRPGQVNEQSPARLRSGGGIRAFLRDVHRATERSDDRGGQFALRGGWSVVRRCHRPPRPVREGHPRRQLSRRRGQPGPAPREHRHAMPGQGARRHGDQIRPAVAHVARLHARAAGDVAGDRRRVVARLRLLQDRRLRSCNGPRPRRRTPAARRAPGQRDQGQ